MFLLIYSLCRYGDRLPLSHVARLVAIVWTLAGVIITGLLVGGIAVSLTNETVGMDYKLYGAKVSFNTFRTTIMVQEGQFGCQEQE